MDQYDGITPGCIVDVEQFGAAITQDEREALRFLFNFWARRGLRIAELPDLEDEAFITPEERDALTGIFARLGPRGEKEYSASIEALMGYVDRDGKSESAAILRVHEAPATGYGDPYVWACTLFVEGDTATFKGAMSAPPGGARDAIKAALKSRGIERRRHERIQGGTRRTINKGI